MKVHFVPPSAGVAVLTAVLVSCSHAKGDGAIERSAGPTGMSLCTTHQPVTKYLLHTDSRQTDLSLRMNDDAVSSVYLMTLSTSQVM